MNAPVALEKKLVTAIAEARQSAGLTYADVADRCGLHRTAISLIERGERHMTLLVFLKICMALSLEPASLFEGIGGRAAKALGTSQISTSLHEPLMPLKGKPSPKK